LRDGETPASSVFNFLYRELRRMAARQLRSERTHASLQPTELVHELFLRISGGSPVEFHDRSHFFAIAAKSMRRILVDRGRARSTLKRGKVNMWAP